LTMPTVLMDESGGRFEFDVVKLLNLVTLWVDNMNATVVIHKFDGDRTGRVHLRGYQVMYVEVVESEVTRSIAPVSYRVDSTAEIVFPTELVVLGTRTVIMGLVTNV